MHQLNAPVVFVIFNRPDKAAITFEAIAKAKPKKLLVIADGARSHVVGEYARCQETRAIIDRVDWECEVLKNFSEVNLGCKMRLATGLDWVFQMVPEAIILEDDCLPAPEFFQFCDELLEHYRFDEDVGMISGCNFQEGIKRGGADYYFSQFCHIWGWATWARAWQKYDVQIAAWPQLQSTGWLKDLGLTKSEQKHWEKSFNKVYSQGLDTWDHQWTFACWKNKMISAMPNINLISNIGFGEGATHTQGRSIFSNIPTGSLRFPLIHPNQVELDMEADRFTAKHQFTDSYLWKIYRKLRAYLR